MDKDTLDEAKEDFRACSDAETEQRKVSLDDLEFARLGKQWPAEVEEQRKKDGRPCLTINRLPAFIKQVTNDARQNRPSITVHPVGDGGNKETAEILNGLIRNIQNVSRADIVYDTGLDFAVTMGFGYWVIRDQYTHDESFDKDLVIERVSNPFSVYGDWEGKEATSADWNRAFITDLYTKKAFDKKWPTAEASSFAVETGDEDTALWFVEDQVRVAEWWKRSEIIVPLLKLSDGSILNEDQYLDVGEDGFSLKDVLDSQNITVQGTRDARSFKVVQRIITGCEVLEENEWKGKYIPIVPVYGDEININGKRHFQSLVRFAKDPARMFNYWRTASTELVALAPKAPYIGAVGSFATDAAKWEQANNATLPYIEYDMVQGAPPPQRQPFTGVPAGALQEALNASDDLKNIMGLHDASLGARSNETSGVAIKARQREGDVSTFNFIDNLSRAIEHTGTILVDLIPRHYNEARIIRCLKEDGSTFSVPINQPAAPVQGAEQPAPGQQASEYTVAPEHIEGMTKVFDLTTGKYDVTVAAGPSFTTRREEASEQMMEFIRVFPQSAPLIGDLLAKNLDWPGADEVAARLKAMLPPQAQSGIPQVVQQLHQQLQEQDGHAREAVGQLQQQIQQLSQELQMAKQQIANKDQEIALKAQANEIKGFEAQTKRYDTVTGAEAAVRDHQLSVIQAASQAAQPTNRPRAPTNTSE